MPIKKLAILAPLFLPVLLSEPAAAANSLTGCAAKKSNLERQLSYAREYGNPYRIAGLERALLKNQHFCRDDLLLAERQRRVQEKEWKVSRRTLEYEDALRRGRDDKAFQRLRKLEEAKAELAEARARYYR